MCIPCLGVALVKLFKEHDEPWVRRYIKNTNMVYILLSLILYMLVISAGLQMYQLSYYSTTEMAQLWRYRFSCSCFLVSSVFV
jgi:polyferredoxin